MILKKATECCLVLALSCAGTLTPALATEGSGSKPQAAAPLRMTAQQAKKLSTLSKAKWAAGGALGAVGLGYAAFVVWIGSSGSWGPGR